MPTTEEYAIALDGPGTPVKGFRVATVASAQSIDLSLQAHPFSVVSITGVTDIANIKPPYPGFQGEITFLFAAATPPDFVSGGSPAAGFFGVALTKSPAQFNVVKMSLIGNLWYSS